MGIVSHLRGGLKKAVKGVRWVAMRAPLSRRGFLMALFGVLFLWGYGLRQKDWILLVLGAIALCLVILGVLMVGFTSLWVGWRMRNLATAGPSDPLHAVVGESTSTGLRLPAWQMPFVDFRVLWLEPNAEVTVDSGFRGMEESVRFSRRWSAQRIVRAFIVRDFFGLSEVRWESEEARTIQVLPRTASFPTTPLRSMSDGEGHYVPGSPRRGDLVDTRAYMPGDPIRHIHWKLFARSQELIVRIQEPSRDYDLKLLAYLICDPFDEYAAEIARWSMESGALGNDWSFGADGCDLIAKEDLATGRELLAQSGMSLEGYGRGLETFLQTVKFDPERHQLLLFASASVWRWLPHIREVLKRHPARCSLIVADNREVDEETSTVSNELPPSEPRWWRFFLLPKDEDEPSQPSLVEELQEFSHHGLELRFASRPRRVSYGKDALKDELPWSWNSIS
ncbi:MAG: DUF58 domain-containing protein [Myxococcales bacterium]|nr:DUF58 domain-containing protein [Myxococcales bacterium]MCB9644833.1 DUF58 domain-containing protein [Myxococcales bacterium]